MTLTAGCTSRSTSDTTPSPTPSIESQVTVPDCPEKPDPLTRENVVEFVVRFENAYVTREILDEHARVTYVTFSAGEEVHPDETEPTVTETDDGFVVRFAARVRHGRQRYDSTHVKDVDEPPYTANYFVSGETILRGKKDGRNNPVDPREEGSAVRCPPE